MTPEEIKEIEDKIRFMGEAMRDRKKPAPKPTDALAEGQQSSTLVEKGVAGTIHATLKYAGNIKMLPIPDDDVAAQPVDGALREALERIRRLIAVTLADNKGLTEREQTTAIFASWRDIHCIVEDALAAAELRALAAQTPGGQDGSD